jgi:hypothetical protein
LTQSGIGDDDTRRIAYNVGETFHTAIGNSAPHHAQSHAFTASDHTAAGLTAGQALEAASATTAAWVSRFLKAYKTADGTAVTDTTLVSDSLISITLPASSNYSFEIIGFVINAGGTEGVKVALAGTVGVTALKAQVTIYDGTLGSIVTFQRVTALASEAGGAVSIGSNYFTIRGTIETSTAGTLLLQTAQLATGAGAGVITQRGTVLEAVRVS